MGKFTASLSKEEAWPLLHKQFIYRSVCQQRREFNRENWPLCISKLFLVQVSIDWDKGSSKIGELSS